MQWISPKDKLPPQGKKILWLKNGDLQIVMRMRNYWVPLPFIDSQFAEIEEPDLWADIMLPPPYFGKWLFGCEGEDRLFDVDYMDATYPDDLSLLIKGMIDTYWEHQKAKKAENWKKSSNPAHNGVSRHFGTKKMEKKS